MKKLIAAIGALTLLFSCSSVFDNEGPAIVKVGILYLEGYNNLGGDLESNLKTIGKNILPTKNNSEVMLALIHKTASNADYVTPTEPVLLRLSSDLSGYPQIDTVKKYKSGSSLSTGSFLNDFLLDVKEMYPAKSYGILFSSHGTGWLPEMYYSHPKSFGCHAYKEGSATCSQEIEIPALAKAIPYHLDYIVFDACLMGCVEVAYELRNTCDHIVFSQTEVLTSGFNYSEYTSRLVRSYPSDVCGFAESYIKQYKDRGSSATVSVVECSKMEQLATVCKELFEKYRAEIEAVNPDSIQSFFRYNYHWYYDLLDILVKSGATSEDLKRLDQAIKTCILYEGHTDYFKEIAIKTNCGFSMFLPSQGTDWLRNYYTVLEWNKATSLVK